VYIWSGSSPSSQQDGHGISRNVLLSKTSKNPLPFLSSPLSSKKTIFSPGKLWARDMERNNDKRKNDKVGWMENASNAMQRDAMLCGSDFCCRGENEIDTSAEDGRLLSQVVVYRIGRDEWRTDRQIAREGTGPCASARTKQIKERKIAADVESALNPRPQSAQACSCGSCPVPPRAAAAAA
jgi:hypothetical protein